MQSWPLRRGHARWSHLLREPAPAAPSCRASRTAGNESSQASRISWPWLFLMLLAARRWNGLSPIPLLHENPSVVAARCGNGGAHVVRTFAYGAESARWFQRTSWESLKSSSKGGTTALSGSGVAMAAKHGRSVLGGSSPFGVAPRDVGLCRQRSQQHTGALRRKPSFGTPGSGRRARVLQGVLTGESTFFDGVNKSACSWSTAVREAGL